jgi:lysophospholipase L1-like esterase
MSDLCLVATMLAKMQHADPQQLPHQPLETPVSLLGRSPKRLQIQRLTPMVFQRSAPAAQAVSSQSIDPRSPEFSCATRSAQAQSQDDSAQPVRLAAANRPVFKLMSFNSTADRSIFIKSKPAAQSTDSTTIQSTGPSDRSTTPSTTHLAPPAHLKAVAYEPEDYRRNGPQSGPQLYSQRVSALKAGRLYTRLPLDSFRDSWANSPQKPSYDQWRKLLALESRAVAKGQGQRRLGVVIGDSLSLWLPAQTLPNSHIWLNQGISGDTTKNILRRVNAFKQTRPDSIYLMAGVNDLRKGESDETILRNLRQIMRQLRSNHSDANIMVQSILPTSIGISSDRIQNLNQAIELIAYQEKVNYLDLYSRFVSDQGKMPAELSTDGLHLNGRGYSIWSSVLRDTETWIAINRGEKGRLIASR